MGLFSALTGLFGGGAQKKAAQKATDAMVAAYNRGIDTQNEFNQQVRTDYKPYVDAGTAAIGQIGNFQGLNGDDARAAAFAGLQRDPRYLALFDQGKETLLQTAAATGGLRGGNTQGALAQLAPSVLANVYDSVISGLNTTAGLGVGAQGAVTQVGGNTANNVTNLQGEIGGAQANNFLARGRINAQNWSNVGSFLDDAVAGAVAGFGGMPQSLARTGSAGGASATAPAPTGSGGFSLLKALGAIF